MGEEGLLDPRRLERAVRELRDKRRRDQVYLAVALSIVGVGALSAILIAGYHAVRQEAHIQELTREIGELSEQSRLRSKALSLDVARQEQELGAIRKAATEDLRSIQEAYQRIATIEDPGRELSALREANAALWSELANQREELLVALNERETNVAVSRVAEDVADSPRFVLEDTLYVESGEQGPGPSAGFVAGAEPLRLASASPAAPGFVIVELTPETVDVGEPFRVVVKLMNRGNSPLALQELRLDWSFEGKNTGGAVPLADTRVVDPRSTSVLYDQSGVWEPSHDGGGVVLGATVTLAGGSKLQNRLRW